MKPVFKSFIGALLLLSTFTWPVFSQTFAPYEVNLNLKEDLSSKTLLDVERALRQAFNVTNPNIIEYRFKNTAAQSNRTNIKTNGLSRRPDLWVYYFIPRKNLVANQEIAVQIGSIPGKVRKLTAWISCQDGIIIYDATPEKNGLTPNNTLGVAPSVGGKLVAFRH